MIKKVSPWAGYAHRHCEYVLAGIVSTFIFSLVVASAATWSGSHLLGRVGRWMVVQEGDWSLPGYDNSETQRHTDAERQLKDYQRQYDDRSRELKQNFKGMKIDTSAAQAALAKLQEGITSLRNALAISVDDFQSLTGDFYYDYQQPLDEAFSALYDQQTYANLERDFKSYKQQLKNMKNDVKRLSKDLKGSPEIAELDAIVKEYDTNLTALEAQYRTLNPANPDDVRDFQSEVTDKLSTQQDFYDKTQDLNQVSNAKQAKKDAQRQVKNITRSIKDMERSIKQAKKYGDTTEAEAMVAERKAILKEIEGVLVQEPFDAEAYWDANSRNGELDQDGWMLINELNEKQNEARQEKDTKRTVKDKLRTVKDLRRQCKKGCQGTKAEVLINEFVSIVEQMEQAANAKNYEDFQSLNNDADALNGEIWPAIDATRIGDDIKNLEHNLKNTDKMLKDVEKQAAKGKITAATLEEIKSAVAALKDAAARAHGAYDKGDTEGAQEAMSDANSAHMLLEDAMGPLEDQRGENDEGDDGPMSPSDLEELVQQINGADEKVDAALVKGTTSKEIATRCRALFAQGKDLVVQILNAGADDVKQMALQEKLGDIGDQVDGGACSKFFEEE